MKLYSPTRIKVMKYYYGSVFLQRYLSVCDVCHRLRRTGSIKTRKYYNLPTIGTITSKSKMCNKCNKGFMKGLEPIRKDLTKAIK
jgi:hypothetical protein